MNFAKKFISEALWGGSMVKFPSQNKLTYQTGDISYSSYSTITSGGTGGHLNLPKDLSMINRRGYHSTKKGVPWVFRTKFDFFLHDEDGAYGPPSVLDNLMVTLKVTGCQNNWVMRNAAVKWHAARENMFSRDNIPKKSRGAYSDEVRYCYDAYDDAWLTPIDGDGDAFTGGTWDVSKIITAADADLKLKLVGVGLDEDSGAAATALQIGHSYLMSRGQPPADSNLETDETPADLSILRGLLAVHEPSGSRIDDITAEASDAQDNPPYELIDISDSGDTSHDVTESVELGRCLSSTQAAVGSCVVDIPFGIADLKVRAYTSENTSGVTAVRGLIHAEVLDIFPMQG